MAQRRQSLREIISLIPVPLYFLIVIIAFNYIANQKQFPEQLPEITLDREITISTTYGKQPQTYTLHKGDVVQFLGYKKSTKTVNLPRAYVQTADGIRGYFDAYELTINSIRVCKYSVCIIFFIPIFFCFSIYVALNSLFSS